MPSFRSTILVRQGLAGWSETYLAAGAIFPDLQAAAGAAETLLFWRRRLSPDDVIFQAVRTSDLDNPRSVFLRQYNQAGTFPIAQGGQPSNLTDMPWTSIKARFADAVGHSRLIYLRGLPDLITNFETGTINNPAWTTSFDAWRVYVLGVGYGGRSLTRGTNPIVPIEGVTDTTDGIVITATAHGLVDGNRIRITSSNTSVKLNGTWIVTSLDADTFLLRGSKKGTDPVTVIKLGRFWKYATADWIATTIDTAGFSSHKVGRPFGLYRGRARRRS